MTLRDSYGEVTVPFGQLFEYRSNISTLATLEVVCADSAMSTAQEPIICVRLVSGFVEKDGKKVGIQPDEDRRAPLFLFTGALVADLVRTYRLTSPPVEIAPGRPQQAPQTTAKTPRARGSKERAEKDQPTSKSLFD